MSKAVVTVASGGMPVVDVTATKPLLGVAVTESVSTTKYGLAVTKVTGTTPGLAVTYVTTGP